VTRVAIVARASVMSGVVRRACARRAVSRVVDGRGVTIVMRTGGRDGAAVVHCSRRRRVVPVPCAGRSAARGLLHVLLPLVVVVMFVSHGVCPLGAVTGATP